MIVFLGFGGLFGSYLVGLGVLVMLIDLGLCDELD